MENLRLLSLHVGNLTTLRTPCEGAHASHVERQTCSQPLLLRSNVSKDRVRLV